MSKLHIAGLVVCLMFEFVVFKSLYQRHISEVHKTLMVSDVGTAGMLCDHATWNARAEYMKHAIVPHEDMVAGGCGDIPLVRGGPYQCRVAVVNAGMPRSGSTLVNQLIVEAIGQLNATSNYRGSLYWQQHIRRAFSRVRDPAAKCAKIRKEYNMTQTFLDSLVDNDIILVKAHEFDATLLDLCKHVVVVASTRDVAEIVFSKARLGWFKMPPDADEHSAVSLLIKSARGAVVEHNCWQRYASRMVQLLFDDMSKNYAAAVLKIMAAILDTLPNSQISPLLTFNVTEINNRFSHVEGNPRLPSTSHQNNSHVDKWLTPEMAMKIRSAYATFQGAHGYAWDGQRTVVTVHVNHNLSWNNITHAWHYEKKTETHSNLIETMSPLENAVAANKVPVL